VRRVTKGLRGVLRDERVRRLLCRLAARYLKLVHLSGRWSVVGGEAPARLWDEGRPFILCFWHGRLSMMPFCWRPGVPIRMLISRHRDGQLIADTVRHFGIDIIAGSTARGGTFALRQLIKALRSGECVGITPDGPRGPRMRASEGVVAVARLAGVPIVPASFGVDRRRVLATWDRFVVPWPFGRGVFVWGPPIRVPEDADAAALEAARREVEDALNRVTGEADRRSGHAPMEPAPAFAPDGASAGQPAEAAQAAEAGEGRPEAAL
jgi:lysophospholipid acyltransferase (LPLAT)-like uncharacterized protein